MFRRTRIAIVVMVAVGMMTSVAAAETPRELLVEQNIGPSAIDWNIGFAYDSAALVVSGPEGLVLRQEFGPGERPAYFLRDASGMPLTDGDYTWQLTVRRSLTGAEQAALKTAQEKVDHMRAEADALRREASGTDRANSTASSDVKSDSAGPKRANVTAQQIEAAEHSVELAEKDLERIRSQLEEQNGAFILRPSGEFDVKSGAAFAPSEPARDIDADGRRSLDSGVGEAPGLKEGPDLKAINTGGNYFTGDVGASSGMCVSCPDNTAVTTGEFRSDDGVPALVLNDETDAVVWNLWTSGGSSTFRIQDATTPRTPFLIEKGATDNSIYIDSTGNVGFRESAPLTDIHITEFAPEVRFEDSSDSTFADVGYNSGTFHIGGNSNQSIVQVAGIAPFQSVVVASDSDVGLGGDPNSVWGFVDLHVDGREFSYSQILQLSTGGYSMWELLPPDLRLVVGPQETATPFTIPFTVDLNAGNNSLTINEFGFVGVGTSNAPFRFSVDMPPGLSYGGYFRTLENGAKPVFALVSEPSTAAAFDNPYFAVRHKNSAGTVKESARMFFAAQDVTAGSEDTDYRLDLAGGGTVNEVMRIKGQTGFVGIGTTSPQQKLDVAGNVVANSYLTSSDVNLKSAFAPIDSLDVLERIADIPISTWTFHTDPSSGRHIGPTAQDFSDAFGLGSDDRHIATVDADGVALAGIQGLYQMVQELQQANEVLMERVAELEAQLHQK